MSDGQEEQGIMKGTIASVPVSEDQEDHGSNNQHEYASNEEKPDSESKKDEGAAEYVEARKPVIRPHPARDDCC